MDFLVDFGSFDMDLGQYDRELLHSFDVTTQDQPTADTVDTADNSAIHPLPAFEHPQITAPVQPNSQAISAGSDVEEIANYIATLVDNLTNNMANDATAKIAAAAQFSPFPEDMFTSIQNERCSFGKSSPTMPPSNADQASNLHFYSPGMPTSARPAQPTNKADSFSVPHNIAAPLQDDLALFDQGFSHNMSGFDNTFRPGFDVDFSYSPLPAAQQAFIPDINMAQPFVGRKSMQPDIETLSNGHKRKNTDETFFQSAHSSPIRQTKKVKIGLGITHHRPPTCENLPSPSSSPIYGTFTAANGASPSYPSKNGIQPVQTPVPGPFSMSEADIDALLADTAPNAAHIARTLEPTPVTHSPAFNPNVPLPLMIPSPSFASTELPCGPYFSPIPIFDQAGKLAGVEMPRPPTPPPKKTRKAKKAAYRVKKPKPAPHRFRDLAFPEDKWKQILTWGRGHNMDFKFTNGMKAKLVLAEGDERYGRFIPVEELD